MINTDWREEYGFVFDEDDLIASKHSGTWVLQLSSDTYIKDDGFRDDLPVLESAQTTKDVSEAKRFYTKMYAEYWYTNLKNKFRYSFKVLKVDS